MSGDKDKLTGGETIAAMLEAIAATQGQCAALAKAVEQIAVAGDQLGKDVAAKRANDEVFIVAAGKQYVIARDGRVRT